MKNTDQDGLHLCLVKTRNIGDQVLLRYQADYLKKKLGQVGHSSETFRTQNPGANTLSIVTSHPQIFWNSKEKIYPASPRSTFTEAIKLLFFFCGLPQKSIFVFYSTHRNKVILGYLAKYLRLFLFKKTLVLSYKSDFLTTNTWSDLDFDFCRGSFLSALARDYWPTRAVLALAESPAPFKRKSIKAIEAALKSDFKTDGSHFRASREQISECTSPSKKSFVALTFGASQAPKMIDLMMIKNLTTYLIEKGRQVVFHKSPYLAPHEAELWREIERDRQLSDQKRMGAIKVFENRSFEDFETFAREASLFICSDSGPKHLAIANGVPTLSFDYSCPMKDWHFYPLEKHLVLRIKVPCRPNCPDQKGYEWCGLNFCDHLSCHKIDFLKVKAQLDYFLTKNKFDLAGAKTDFPELESFN